jgi:hypothetical protein
MRPAKDIKKMIKSVPVGTNAEKDKEVLDDVLSALEKSRKELPAAWRPIVWRTIMKNNITKLAAATFVVALLVGVCQIDATRAAFARTTKVVSTGLVGLKAFILDMKAREPEPPSAVPPVDSNEQEAAFQGRSIIANVLTYSVKGEQRELRDFLEVEGIEWLPAGNDSNMWYAELDPDKTKSFISFTQTDTGIKLISSPGLMVKEGEEGIIGIHGTEGQDAVALALVATVPDDDSINLSFSFLHGQNGFEVPILRIRTGDSVLFRLSTVKPAQDVQNEQNGPDSQADILVFFKAKVF